MRAFWHLLVCVTIALTVFGCSGTTPGDVISDVGVVTETVTAGNDDQGQSVTQDVANWSNEPSDVSSNTETSIAPGQFGSPCSENGDCFSGWCVEGDDGYVCTKTCQEDCPDGWECKSILSSSTDVVFLCVPMLESYCAPCTADLQCNGGSCRFMPDGSEHCTYACDEENPCPSGFSCDDATDEGEEGTWCVPVTGTCTCFAGAGTAGSQRSCNATNELGSCFGFEICDPELGWVGCDANEPVVEDCDGLDNDCDGLVDESLVTDVPCENTVEGIGTCDGSLTCQGPNGWLCQGPVPSTETCNYSDDDCDGVVDETFVDDAGAYTLIEHCGSCDNACTDKFDGGVGTCAGTPEAPQCVVESCDAGLVKISDFQCGVIPASPCQPCLDDADCFGGTCVETEGQGACALPCGLADSEDGCALGYSCESIEVDLEIVERCLPVNGTCSCGPANDGEVRSCSNANEYGICFGTETCDAAEGWLGCTAGAPLNEVCDGADNDCDGTIDDGLAGGEPCENTADGIGSCAGVQVCNGTEGWSCVGPAPSLELCDFQDNDCDGSIDEDFTAPDGSWTLDIHCGTCGNDCSDKILNGTGACGGTSDAPACVVDACDAGYVAISPFQCALPPDVSCQPCIDDSDCFDGTCTELDGQLVCAGPCQLIGATCPVGYECQNIGDDDAPLDRCLPVTGSCQCGDLTAGQTRTCANENDHGMCFGFETCEPLVGWDGCTASIPDAETCNGLDDDCNGLVDDNVSPPLMPCVQENDFGTCSGSWSCSVPEAGVETQWWCSAADPGEDVCDLVDNDCDGVVDGPFKDAATGAYLHDDHCGACGVSCANAIPNATATCTMSDAGPRCEIDTCDSGYYPIGPLACLVATEALCMPCQSDANCPTPGDRCMQLDNTTVCGRDCSEGNLHGTPAGACPDGFSCNALEDGSSQCQPNSLSCSCLSEQAGDTRTCVAANEVGSCFGEESCDPTQGWVNCSATIPMTEICNDVDDDCNNLVDDVEDRGAPCGLINEYGACSGTLDCLPGDTALQCSGQVPSIEICNYQDDNCNGQQDETFPLLYSSCNVGVGACLRYGFVQCTADGLETLCTAEPGEASVETCNGLDDDCDGVPDEDYPELGSLCTVGEGACAVSGNVICDPEGQGTICSATPSEASAVDICDGTDDDCDGATDEDFGDLSEVCTVGEGACQVASVRVCNAEGDGTECNAEPGAPGVETCNYFDDDCNGEADEPYETLYEPCSVGLGICQRFGFQVCTDEGDGTECNAEPAAAGSESCNGLDDNCDGETDEDFPELGEICEAGSGACKNSGLIICNPLGTGTQCSASGGTGEAEICDGLDNDCNGLTDEDFPELGTVCTVGSGTCTQAGTWICTADATAVSCSATPLPPGDEHCNGIDDDCSGEIDDNLPDAPECAKQEGVCEGAVQTCGGLSGWRPCTGVEYGSDFEPTELTCDGLDNDCDGEADNNLFAPACPSQQGVCSGATKSCSGEEGWSECAGAEYGAEWEQEETTCDGLDNDCDGLVDEGFANVGSVCSVGVGACLRSGTWLCDDSGAGTSCSESPGEPQEETCNGEDDNCDGVTDNTLTDVESCTNQLGVCSGATRSCGGASGWLECGPGSYGPNYEPTELSCDGLDNDCDGEADEDLFAEPCPLQKGVCAGTLTPCLGPGGWGQCSVAQYGLDYQVEEAACDGLDNDCDGLVDEPYPQLGQVCQVGVGACLVTGTLTCADNAAGVVCSAEAGTSDVEICNGLDDDCDGLPDNMLTDGESCALQAGVCEGAMRTCGGAGGYQTCTAGNYGNSFEATEITCDGLDNDCDGQTDDNLAQPACTLQAGVCAGSKQTCAGNSGFMACGAPEYGTSYEGTETLCDGLDNDCDGNVDEPYPTLGQVCSVGEGACVGLGTITCLDDGSGVGCSAVPGDDAPELCNGIDDDCDGITDNALSDGEPCLLQQGVCVGANRNCGGTTGYLACTALDYGVGYEAVEITCDGLDNDCDGAVDNGLIAGQCAKQKGVCAGTIKSCNGVDGWSTCDATEYGDDYEADEVTCDGLDNDCDGLIDEDFGTGQVCVVGVGTCQTTGTTQCAADGASTECSATPASSSVEICNGLDDDCDGEVDNDLTDGELCTTQAGVCSGAVRVCGGASGYLNCGASQYGDLYEATELTCDGKDNDCDGVVDNGLSPGQCGKQQGVCAGAVKSCAGGAGWSACGGAEYGADYEDDEATCDNKDNDCDGLIDEGFGAGQVCIVGVGTCQATGTTQCTANGISTQCSAAPSDPSPELCNGLDDDCDGSPDNDTIDGEPCAKQLGVCQNSERTCGGAGGYETCTASNYGADFEATELSCDGLDNDCDGEVDNDLPPTPCPAQEGVCAGSFASCSGDGGWNSCGPSEYGGAYEADEVVCDSQDNDCDGVTDEGWLNPATGAYDKDEACGSCYTDCTVIYDKDNAYGDCNVTGTPFCVMECDDGAYDLNSVPDDGCEFVLDSDSIYVSATDDDADDLSGCGLGPVGTGAGNRPCISITQGLAEALATGRSTVRVAGGAYTEQVTLLDGKHLLGGYNATTWGRDIAVNLSLIQPEDSSGHAKTVIAEGLTGSTTLEGFVIYGGNPTDAGKNSYAVYVEDCDASLSLLSNTIYGGSGAAGDRGEDGSDGGAGVNGAEGTTGFEPGQPECSTTVPGGAGGQRSCGGISVNGGNGGQTSCRPDQGVQASASDGDAGANNVGAAGAGGAGGQDGGTQWGNSQFCGTCQLPGGTMTGSPASDGENGADGAGGNGSSNAQGVISSSSEWIGVSGGVGVSGLSGGGGGGGGAGGGAEDIDLTQCNDDLGGTGGGGGSGACGGGGGSGGQSGGGSFGIFLHNCAQAPTIEDNTIYRGEGGQGGDGGNGGVGGLGGDGANGGVAASGYWQFCTGDAGRGGQGGNGGQGGGGGGGAGGVSYGIWTSKLSGPPVAYEQNNTFPASGAAGNGGSGGSSLGNNGNAGLTGESGNVKL